MEVRGVSKEGGGGGLLVFCGRDWAFERLKLGTRFIMNAHDRRVTRDASA